MNNDETIGVICTKARDRSRTQRRWSMLALPLLCGLLVEFCLVLLPFRPPSDHSAILWIAGAVLVLAGALEMSRSNSLRERGLIEVRPVRYGGVERSAFVIPYSPHYLVVGVLAGLFLNGVSFDLLIRASLHPTLFPDPWLARMLGGFALTLGLLGTGICLRWSFLCPPGLALLPEGLLLSTGMGQWFIAWEWMEQVALVKFRFLGGYRPLGLRLIEVDQLPIAAWRRRRLRCSRARSGWHCLWPLWCYTLPSRQIAFLVNLYRQNPGERPNIASEAGAAYLSAALAYLESVRATGKTPAGAHS